jgi:hypothetical protein
MNPEQQPLHGQAFVLVASLALLLFILELVRRKKIGERFSLLWILVALGMCVAASLGFPFLFRLAPVIGVVYPATALFLLAFLGLTFLSIYFTVHISQLSHQSRILAQKVALLEDRAPSPPGPDGEAPPEAQGERQG